MSHNHQETTVVQESSFHFQEYRIVVNTVQGALGGGYSIREDRGLAYRGIVYIVREYNILIYSVKRTRD